MRRRKSARWAAVALYGVASASIGIAADSMTTCSNCAECEAALASGLHDLVVLDADIIDHTGSCIELNWGESHVTLDCAGHLIDGDGGSVEPVRAVSLMQGEGNTIRNCAITDFDAALYLVNESGVVLENNLLLWNKVGIDLSNGASNTLSGNLIHGSEMGIKITHSDNNTVIANTACGNNLWDIYDCCSVDNVGIDNTCDTTDGWNDTGTDGCTSTCPIFSCGFETGDLRAWSESNG